ncbi:fumarate reductase subunit FrdD [soil metagenome]
MAVYSSPAAQSPRIARPAAAPRHAGRSHHAVWWALFSAGGMLSAMFFPILMVTTGIVIPFGLATEGAIAYERVYPVLSHPLVKLALFGLIALPLFHWAHRFLYTLVETGLRGARQPLAILCYGTAILGTAVAAFILWRL